MAKTKTNYLLTNENGETKELCGMRAVANFIGCVDSTIYVYQNSGKPYKGWYINVVGSCDCAQRIIQNGYKKRIRYREKDWNYKTYYPAKKTIALSKTYFVPNPLDCDFNKLDINVRNAIKLLVKRLKNDLDKQYICYTKMPKYLNGKNETAKSLYYVELHFKFRELNNFKDWVNFLAPWIERLDTYIKKLIGYEDNT